MCVQSILNDVASSVNFAYDGKRIGRMRAPCVGQLSKVNFKGNNAVQLCMRSI